MLKHCIASYTFIWKYYGKNTDVSSDFREENTHFCDLPEFEDSSIELI